MKLDLVETFKMKELGEARAFHELGTQYQRTERKLLLTQPKHVSSVMVKFSMNSFNAVGSLMKYCKMVEFEYWSS